MADSHGRQIRVELNNKEGYGISVPSRFGLRLFLDRVSVRCVTAECKWGRKKAIPDKHQASWHGILGNVRTMHRPYLKPQEYGAHWDWQLVLSQRRRDGA